MEKELLRDIDERISVLEKRSASNTPTDEEIEEYTRLLKVKSYLKSERKLSEGMKIELIRGGFSLTALLLILKYEELNVITTKGFSIFQKLLR